MFKLVPIFIVLFFLAILWLIGKILAVISSKTEDVKEQKIRGIEIFSQCHVVGLNELGIEELRSLMDNKDIDNLTIFLALKKPTFVELDNYMESLREQFLNVIKTPVKAASEVEKITAASTIDLSDSPEGYDFTQISKAELRALLEHDSKKRRIINQDFMSRFGETHFMEHFQAYKEMCAETPVTMVVAEDDPKRKHLDVFVKTGIALQGRKIPLRDRLSVLKFNQLREMGKELKIDKEFKRRADATESLAEIPGSAILLAMLVNIDDIFMIKPEPIDLDAVEKEWMVINSYAKLLC